MDFLAEAEVAAEVAATIREAGALLKEVIFTTIVKGTHCSFTTKNLHASSVAVVENYMSPETAVARYGVTHAKLIPMDHVRANGYRKQ